VTESGSPRAAVSDVIELLHGLANVITVRAHYSEGHPAIDRADAAAAASFNAFSLRTPELVVALIEGEFVVNERPMPGLRRHLGALADGMARHEIECFVFQRGISAVECGLVGRTLRMAATNQPALLRAELQGGLKHVLLRFAALKRGDGIGRETRTLEYVVPEVCALHAGVVDAIAKERLVDVAGIRALAARMAEACHARAFAVPQRAYAPGILDEAAHATNVAFMCGAMAIEAGYEGAIVADLMGAALVHDVGLLLFPARIRGVPEPLLEERDKALFRSHPTTGAAALLASGCPPLWVAGALDHHRGVDGAGYPANDERTLPHDLVRMIALASYFDRRRTRLDGVADEPEQVLRAAATLEERYFGSGLVPRFLRALGMYLPGTTVELSDRSVALVVQPNQHDPLRPQVRVIFGNGIGKRVELKDLNAIEDRHALSIVRAIEPPLARQESQPEAGIPILEPLTDEDDVPVLEPVPQEDEDVPVLEPLEEELPVLEPVTEEDVPTLEPLDEFTDLDDIPLAELVPEPVTGVRSRLPPPVAVRASAVPNPAIELHRVPRLRSMPGDLMKLGLDHHAGFLLTFVDGSSTVEEVLDASGIPRAEGIRILHDLVARGVIAF
jgi:hypothetical protein